MLKHFLGQKRERGTLPHLGCITGAVTRKVLRAQRFDGQPSLTASTYRPSSPSLVRCCLFLTTRGAVTAATAARPDPTPSVVFQQCRPVSASYTAAVPCARFDVDTKDLARITNQPTLPPTANVYIMDLRKKHISKTKKKPNPRRTMSNVINAHRAEKTKAGAADAGERAHVPPLIFLVKTDDTVKQAARRQQVMDEQLKALGAYGEFRVCVLSGPKSRHWLQYIPAEDRGGEEGSTTLAATSVTSSPSITSTDAVGVAAAAAVGLTTSTVAQRTSAPDQNGHASLSASDHHSVSLSRELGRPETPTTNEGNNSAEAPHATSSPKNEIHNTNTGEKSWQEADASLSLDAEGGEGVASDGSVEERVEGEEVEEEWEEVEEVEEVDDEEGVEKVGESGVEQQYQQEHTLLKVDERAVTSEQDAVSLRNTSDSDSEEKLVVGLSSPPDASNDTTASASPATAATMLSSTVGTGYSGFDVRENSFYGSSEASSVPDRQEGSVLEPREGVKRGKAAEKTTKTIGADSHNGAVMAGVTQAEAEKDDEVVEEEEEVEFEEVEEEEIELPSSAANDAHLATREERAGTVFPTSISIQNSSESPVSLVAVGAPVQTSKTKRTEEVLEEFDLDGPIVGRATPAPTPSAMRDVASTTRDPVSPHPPTESAVNTAPPLTAKTTFTARESEAVPPASQFYQPGSAPEAIQRPITTPELTEKADQERNTGEITRRTATKDPADETNTSKNVDSAEAEGKVLESATRQAPSPPPRQTQLPKPTMPMPVYPDVPARLYNGASTVYLSDRALRELPLTANVLVIDHLDWSDDTVNDIETMLAQVDPVVGHVLLYRDAYAPQSACVIRENLVFRDALVPFIFVFRTSLSQSAARVQQRRFVEALRSRPAGLSVEQQALLAGQRDRTYVCVLCAEESRRGGENPLEDPELRHRAAAVPKVPKLQLHQEEEELNTYDAAEHDAAPHIMDATVERAPVLDSSDAREHLRTMMNVSCSAPPGFLTDVLKPGSYNMSDNLTADQSTKVLHATNPARASEKKHFSVPVPSYEMEEEDLIKSGNGNSSRSGSLAQTPSSRIEGEDDNGNTSSSSSSFSSSSSRRGKNVRAANKRSFDLSSAPPTSLPSKQAPPPLSLGLLGFEKVVFGKQNACNSMNVAYGHREHDETTRSSGGRGITTKTAVRRSHSIEDEEGHHHVEEESEDADAQDFANNPTLGAQTHNRTQSDSSLSPLQSLNFSGENVLEADKSVMAETKSWQRSSDFSFPSSNNSRRYVTKIQRSRGVHRGKTTKKSKDNTAAVTAAVDTQLKAEDAALEDFILSLYKDSDKEDTELCAKTEVSPTSQKNEGDASTVSSARSLLKSASRKKRGK